MILSASSKFMCVLPGVNTALWGILGDWGYLCLVSLVVVEGKEGRIIE